MKKIALLPLDERPVNTRYPQMIAEIAEAEVMLPPEDVMSHRRVPASPDRLAEWLTNITPDVLIASVEMLGYGGLIASRITEEPVTNIIARLTTLATLKHDHPDLSIYGFNLVTRTPNHNYAFEEPPYWEDYGMRIHRLSALYHQRENGDDVADDIATLEADIPLEHRQDWLQRRLRNHSVNLAVLELLAQGTLDLLVLSSDDTSVYGLGTREKAWLADWAQLALPDESRLLMYPGADEVGCVLLARAMLAGESPRFAIHHAIPGDENRTAPYEDGAVKLTVERQIHALGGVIVPDDNTADFVVMVNPPSRIEREFDPTRADEERTHRTPHLRTFVEGIAGYINAGKRVIVADVAYPNGADPILIDLLTQHIDLTRLAAYGAWNTAGNTIGTALAQGVALSLAKTDAGRTAHTRFLVHRFVEDWAYQHFVRDEVRDWLEAQTGIRDTTLENIDTATAMIHDKLNARLESLPGIGEKWRISAVRLPWQRTFEVDFDLEPHA